MKKLSLLSAFVLFVGPFSLTHAFIEKPEIQFKTPEQIRAQALEKLNDRVLSEDDARLQRLINLTRDINTGDRRVKSAKENFKKSLGRPLSNQTSSGAINKGLVPRSSRAFDILSGQREASTPTTQVAQTVQERLRARRALRSNK